MLRKVLDSIIFSAIDSTPFECCGILLAHDEDHIVFTSLSAENREKKNSQIKYILGHKTHLKAVEMEVTARVYIAGYYHSHPRGGIKPSHSDAEQAIEGAIYLITAPINVSYEHAAWKWKNNQFMPVTLEVSD